MTFFFYSTFDTERVEFSHALVSRGFPCAVSGVGHVFIVTRFTRFVARAVGLSPPKRSEELPSAAREKKTCGTQGNLVIVFVYIARIVIFFLQMKKGELTILSTKHGL